MTNFADISMRQTVMLLSRMQSFRVFSVVRVFLGSVLMRTKTIQRITRNDTSGKAGINEKEFQLPSQHEFPTLQSRAK